MCDIPIKKIQTLHNTYTFQERFFIQDLEVKLNGKPMIESLHRHDFFFILVLEKGVGSHAIDFISYEVKDHTLFFIKPGQVHALTLSPKSKGYLLHFSGEAYHANNTTHSQLLHKVARNDYYALEPPFFKSIYPLLTAIYDEQTKKAIGYEEIIRANLSILFTKLTRKFPNTDSISKGYTQERFEVFLELLETHMTHKKQVSQYADMMNLSVYQLNMIVKSSVDKTCSELIKEHIILEAKRYLLATSKQINQIAAALGYEDVSYFIRLFKKHTQYAPNSFRQNFK
jgi:YesN/AraC family two-component response regulator